MRDPQLPACRHKILDPGGAHQLAGQHTKEAQHHGGRHHGEAVRIEGLPQEVGKVNAVEADIVEELVGDDADDVGAAERHAGLGGVAAQAEGGMSHDQWDFQPG